MPADKPDASFFFLKKLRICNVGPKFSEMECIPLQQSRLLYAVFGNSQPVAVHQIIKPVCCDSFALKSWKKVEKERNFQKLPGDLGAQTNENCARSPPGLFKNSIITELH